MSEKMERKGNKIDVDRIDLEKEREKVSDMPGLIAFPHTVGGAVIRPEDTGKIKGRSLAAMREQTSRQMKQLYKQAQLLAEQAQEIQKRAEVSERIYTSHMNFEPLIGHTYYLYERKDGTDLLSMVAPDEWGRSQPFSRFLARVKLLSDHTWEVSEEQEEQ
ncbi:DUF2452 domain-containing protein [Nafulsella turpanensis]|uniref:DUF2452 domain-containing protein n=1 Tax=Nafulsella turpanensis TaxID=1265690 RepID=UPI0003496340